MWLISIGLVGIVLSSIYSCTTSVDGSQVKILHTDEAYLSTIHDPYTNTLILFHTPSCQMCKDLEPEWRRLAEHYATNPHLVVASVNVNEFKPKEGMPKLYLYPTIMLYPAGLAQGEKVAINYGYLFHNQPGLEQLVWITETFAVYPEDEEFSKEKGSRVIDSEPVSPVEEADEGVVPKRLVGRSFHNQVFNETHHTLVLFHQTETGERASFRYRAILGSRWEM